MASRRLVLLLSGVVFADTVFYAAVAPLLPHYAGDLGLSKASAGVLSAAYPAGTLLGALPGGVLASRLGAKVTVLLGLALLAASSLAFGFAHHIALLDAARFVQGIGGACSWAGAMAWLVSEAPPERRGAMIGTALGAGIAGSLFGPVVGAVAVLTAPAPVFGSVVIVAGLLAIWAARTPLADHSASQGAGDAVAALRRPPVLAGMWLVALPALGFGCIAVLGPLRLDRLGASGTGVGAAFLVAAAAESVISPIAGRMSDRSGRLVPIRLGLAAAAVVLVCLTLPRHAVGLAVAIVAAATALGFFWAPAMALLADAAERTGLHHGLAFALVNLAWAAGQGTGSAAGGALAKATTDAVPFAVVAALCVTTLGAVGRRRALAPSPA